MELIVVSYRPVLYEDWLANATGYIDNYETCCYIYYRLKNISRTAERETKLKLIVVSRHSIEQKYRKNTHRLKYSRNERPPRPSVSRSLWRLRVIRVPTKIRSNVEKQSSDRNRGSTSLGVVARACQSFRYRRPRAFRTCSTRNAHAPRYATYRRTVLNWRDVELS